jgi:hypothetical protein
LLVVPRTASGTVLRAKHGKVLNARLEHFMRAFKEVCLDRIIFFDESSLRYASGKPFNYPQIVLNHILRVETAPLLRGSWRACDAVAGCSRRLR